MPSVFGSGLYGAGIYGEADTPASTALTCWSFVEDGHTFVALELGTQGTYVYDAQTSQWSLWNLSGSVSIPSTVGVTFDSMNLVGDRANGNIYILSPEENADENSSFDMVVTTGMTTRRRDFIQCPGVFVSGNRTELSSAETITLFVSDDDGKTFTNMGSLSLDDSGLEVQWRSLGLIQPPGKIFQIIDSGVFKTIDGINMAGM